MKPLSYLVVILVTVLPITIQSSENENDKMSDTSIEQTEDSVFSGENNYEDKLAEKESKSEEIDNSIPLDSIPEDFLSSKEHWATTKSPKSDSYENSLKEHHKSIKTKEKKIFGNTKRHNTNETQLGKADNGTREAETITIKSEGEFRAKAKIEAPKLKYPYTVSIQKRGAHYASGALVTLRWVITSAREFYNVRESIRQFRIRYDTVNCKRGKIMPIISITLHPGFYQAPNYDVSLLKMAADIVSTNSVTPIPLAKVGMEGNMFLTTYWARLIINNKVLPTDAKERFKSHSLRVSKQSLLPWEQCDEELKKNAVTMTASSGFCLKPIVDHHSKCLPDPGAPVVLNGVLYGVTSSWTSDNCQEGRQVTVVTAVTHELTRDWIIGTVS